MYEIKNQDYAKPDDSSWKGPMKVLRDKTDPRALKFYLLSLVLWLGIGIYAFGYSILLDPTQLSIENDFIESLKNRTFNLSLTENITEPENYEVLKHIFTHLPLETFRMVFHNPKGLLNVIGCSILAAIISVHFIWLFCHRARFVLKFILGLLCFILLYTIISSFIEGGSKIVSGVIFSIILTVIVVFFVRFRSQTFVSCKIVNVASKLCFSSYHFLLVVCRFILTLTALMLFANNVRLLIRADKAVEKPHGAVFSIFIILLHLGNFLGWLWTSNFIYSVEMLILSGSFSTWYWTLNKESVPQNTVQFFTNAVWKHHLGTIAIGSGFLSILEALFYFFAGVECDLAEPYDVLFNVFTFCFSVLMYAVVCVARDSFVVCALQGTDFYTSLKRTYRLIRKNLKKFTVIYVSFLVIRLVEFLAVIIPMFFAPHLSQNLKIDKLYIFLITLILVYYVVNAFFNFLQISFDTIFICTIDDFERNDGSEERPFYKSRKLKNLMLHE